MKAMLIALISLMILPIFALDCLPYGPNADQITAVHLAGWPECYGVIEDAQKMLVIFESGLYQEYSFSGGGLSIKSILLKDENTLMVLMGDGTYSDGLWDFDLTEHSWTINEWFAFPNFLRYSGYNSTYYLGTEQGLYHSADAETWNRIWDLGEGDFTELTCFEGHFACLKDSFVYTSHNAGENWQSTTSPFFESIRYTDNGVLYGIMARMSDSDGLWRSWDYGENWELVFYSSNLSCIGPNFGNKLPLGWSDGETNNCTVFLLDHHDNLIALDHPNLYAPSIQMDIFPFVNTPSFYVVNDNGLFFITGFLEVEVDDLVSAPAHPMTIYPNPGKANLKLKLGKCEAGESLRLYDIKGRMLCSMNIDNSQAEQIEWNLNRTLSNALPAGIYFVRRVNALGKTLAVKRVTLIN